MSALARMPAHHTTVAAGITSPPARTRPCGVTPATDTPPRASTPSAARAVSTTRQAPSPMPLPTRDGMVDQDDPRRLAARLGRRGAEGSDDLGGTLDSGEAAADHDGGVAPGRGRTRRQGRDVRLKPLGGGVGVDVEAVFQQARDRRTQQRAAQREHQAIIGQHLAAGGRLADDLPVGDIYRGDVADHAVDPDRLQHLGQGDPEVGEIRLVVAHADAVPVVAIDQRDTDPVRRDAALVEQPGGAGGAPQAGEAAAQDQDLLHVSPLASPPLGL